MIVVKMYTDGSCSGNPGPGGWGVVLTAKNKQKQLSGYLPQTTNNEAELYAVLQGLRAIKASCNVKVYTDSQNAIGWLSGRYKCKKPHLVQIRNQIWETILDKNISVSYVKVKGHSGDPLNDLADALATSARGDA